MNLLFRVATVAALAGFATPFAAGTGQHPKEIKGWGTVTDPDGDCTFKEDKGKLLIRFPSSRGLVHWARNWGQRLSHPSASGVDARFVSGAASFSAPPVCSTGLGGDFRPTRLVTATDHLPGDPRPIPLGRLVPFADSPAGRLGPLQLTQGVSHGEAKGRNV